MGMATQGWLAGQFEKRAAIHTNFDQTEAHPIPHMTTGAIFNELNVSIFIFPSKIFIYPWCKIFSILSILYLIPFKLKVRIYSKELQTLKRFFLQWKKKSYIAK